MSTILGFMFFIPLACYVITFWGKLLKKMALNQKGIIEKATRIHAAATEALRDEK
jgi:hypothetical protein